MKPKVYIDGEYGTTGLRIRKWLSERRDLELLSVPEARRKDPGARREQILAADVSVLCLPDEAAREAALWVKGSKARLIDASTAHRTAWRCEAVLHIMRSRGSHATAGLVRERSDTARNRSDTRSRGRRCVAPEQTHARARAGRRA